MMTRCQSELQDTVAPIGEKPNGGCNRARATGVRHHTTHFTKAFLEALFKHNFTTQLADGKQLGWIQQQVMEVGQTDGNRYVALARTT